MKVVFSPAFGFSSLLVRLSDLILLSGRPIIYFDVSTKVKILKGFDKMMMHLKSSLHPIFPILFLLTWSRKRGRTWLQAVFNKEKDKIDISMQLFRFPQLIV